MELITLKLHPSVFVTTNFKKAVFSCGSSLSSVLTWNFSKSTLMWFDGSERYAISRVSLSSSASQFINQTLKNLTPHDVETQ